jgi:glycosyltransferase involved in cell wall biosynthesis
LNTLNTSYNPLISIITIVYNNAQYVRGAIESVILQNYEYIEYIIIDGGSTDGTLEVINEYSNQISMIISEPDSGIYDALNKGLKVSTGDYVGFLHSDDFFIEKTLISDVVSLLQKSGAEFCFGNSILTNSITSKVVRYYQSGFFHPFLFRLGWMPPHPTCFYERKLHQEFGYYSTEYRIAGDFDFLTKVFMNRKVKWIHYDCVMVNMRLGGASNIGIKSKKIIASEIRQSLKNNHVWAPLILQIFRYIIRVFELILRPPK